MAVHWARYRQFSAYENGRSSHFLPPVPHVRPFHARARFGRWFSSSPRRSPLDRIAFFARTATLVELPSCAPWLPRVGNQFQPLDFVQDLGEQLSRHGRFLLPIRQIPGTVARSENRSIDFAVVEQDSNYLSVEKASRMAKDVAATASSLPSAFSLALNGSARTGPS